MQYEGNDMDDSRFRPAMLQIGYRPRSGKTVL